MRNLNAAIISALEKEPTIACYRDEAHLHPGSTADHLATLGIEKRMLKLLERHGMAVRGRSDDKGGHRVKWILIVPRTLYAKP